MFPCTLRSIGAAEYHTAKTSSLMNPEKVVTMSSDLPTQYVPSAIEPQVYARWLEAKAFAAFPDDNPQPYVIMMPLPNVTGALHMMT